MDPNDILTNPLHPLNPITDPYGIYGGSSPARSYGPTPRWVDWLAAGVVVAIAGVACCIVVYAAWDWWKRSR